MDQEQIIKLVFDVVGKEAADKLRQSFDALKSTTHSTADAYEVLERQVGEYEVLERRVTQTTQTVVQAEAEHIGILQQLGVQTEIVATAGGKLGKTFDKNGEFGHGILQASFAVQDFTSVLGNQGLGRAIASVQNNIPLMLTSFGAGAGLAGVVSVVSVGIGLLIDNWDKLTGQWKDGETEREAKRMKDLAKAAEDAWEATQKLLKTPEPERREPKRDIQRAIDAFGGEAVTKEIEAALKARQGDFGAEANRKMAQRFIHNLMQGERSAVNMLGDLDLHGEIGEVLRGGKTPEEHRKVIARGLEREAKERQEADKKKEAEAKKATKDAEHKQKQAEDEWERFQAPATRRWEAGQTGAGAPRGRDRFAPRGRFDLHRAMASGVGLFSAEEGAAAQQQVFQATGERVSPRQAVETVRRQQAELVKAQKEAADAILSSMDGTEQQIAILKQLAKRARQGMDQGVMPSGLPR